MREARRKREAQNDEGGNGPDGVDEIYCGDSGLAGADPKPSCGSPPRLDECFRWSSAGNGRAGESAACVGAIAGDFDFVLTCILAVLAAEFVAFVDGACAGRVGAFCGVVGHGGPPAR